MSSPIKTFVVFTSVVLFLISIIWLASPDNKAPAVANIKSVAPAVLSAEEYAFDFGDISMYDGTVARIFNLRNDGAEPVNIAKVYTSCMCTKAIVSTPSSGRKGPFGMPGHGIVPSADAVLNPGETAEIKVVFDPAAHGPAGVGRIERSVYLENEGGLLAELRISGNVTP